MRTPILTPAMLHATVNYLCRANHGFGSPNELVYDTENC
jgi:hypothetical protein